MRNALDPQPSTLYYPMYSRWFNVAVVLLWLATMGWLMVAKLLPPLLVGDPPNYRTILRAQQSEPPVGWRLLVGNRPVGWAVSTVDRLPSDVTEVHSRVHFDQLPLAEMLPRLLRPLLQSAGMPSGKLQVRTESTLTFDALGRLSRFRSSAYLGPLKESIQLQGTVDAGRLKLHVRMGGSSFPPIETDLPQDALLSGALSPQTRLPGLRPGQRWTVPVYSPLKPKQPLEILQATVEGVEPIVFDGRTENAWLVVYRRDPGQSSDQMPRGRLWVRRDGAVLRQELKVLGSRMSFVRLSEKQAARLIENAASDSRTNGSDSQDEISDDPVR